MRCLRELSRPTLVLCLVVAWGARTASADPADDLFNAAQDLKDHGKFDEACVKFQQALDINPNAVGTILNVALCDEKANKLATAQRLYERARALAEENKLEEHKKAAVDKLAALTPRVPHVAFAFTE